MSVACALFSFDRPLYLERTLQSVYVNCLKHNTDLYIFQDGSTTANGRRTGSKERIEQCINIVRKYQNKLPNLEMDVSNVNVGTAKQKQKAHQLFERGYKKVIFFEDDMILSPHYIRIILQMSEQFPRSIVQASDRADYSPPHNLQAKLSEVRKSGDHLWGYLIDDFVYHQVRDLLNDYVDFIGDDYVRRPHRAIMKRYNVNASSHDKIIHKATDEQKISRLTTVIPRARYIGMEGTHASPAWYKKHGFERERSYVFDEDEHIREFTVV